MDFIERYIAEVWSMTTLLAPWLLAGFALAGLISLFLRRSLVTKVLGKPGIGSIAKATILGAPMPLCSCGVIPVAAAIREKGAGKGATAAFLASTPQTGVDNAAATWGLLGPIMTVVSVVVAFVSGLLAGLFVEFATRGRPDERELNSSGHDAFAGEKRPSVTDAFKQAFIKMPEEMSLSLVSGILIAALASTLLPADIFSSFGSSGFPAYAIITLVSIPVYVCATGSIPLAAAMIHAGFSPGSALLFLIVGPSTNVSTILAMRRYITGRGIVAYLAAIVITSWGAGIFVDTVFGRDIIAGQMPHHMEAPSLVGTIAAVILALMLLRGLLVLVLNRLRKPEETCCCACSTARKEASAETCSCENNAATPHSCTCGEKKKDDGESCSCGH